jgi:hypothetical protein
VRALAGLVALLGFATSCAQVLGIEDAEPDPQTEDICGRYCDTVLAACTGDFAVYLDRPTCTAACAHFEPGVDGETAGNTIGCRLTQAQAAETGDKALLCPRAGPGGAGICSTNCLGFCTVFQGACPDEFNQLGGDIGSCVETCDEEIPTLGDAFDIRQRTGDTLQCRLYHVSLASQTPQPHCSHAAGEDTCTAD